MAVAFADASKSGRHGETQDTSHITSEVFAKKFTAEELRVLMSHAYSSLDNMGYSIIPRQDMQHMSHPQHQQQQEQAQQQQQQQQQQRLLRQQ